ncbi:ribosomal protein L7Ae/L30e/S12e/Gadd45 family protein [Artemisia annua]|uniref:Ribosomal protein L7Ae/L30e/S12e/Gadd45 family protein n=1 Tax=Artemisia annua TaxID=35608 RepID=A0A2U1MWZ7_ARTAN|nr:ribosomal protein L7Ae/L30e/S12e/Gadd45 family protein [Artemisia annua]
MDVLNGHCNIAVNGYNMFKLVKRMRSLKKPFRKLLKSQDNNAQEQKFATKKKTEKVVNPLFEKRPKQFGISRALPPCKDIHRSDDVFGCWCRCGGDIEFSSLLTSTVMSKLLREKEMIGVGFERGQDLGSLTVAREHGSVAAPFKSAPSDLDRMETTILSDLKHDLPPSSSNGKDANLSPHNLDRKETVDPRTVLSFDLELPHSVVI